LDDKYIDEDDKFLSTIDVDDDFDHHGYIDDDFPAPWK
jgi:hypothetical protein